MIVELVLFIMMIPYGILLFGIAIVMAFLAPLGYLFGVIERNAPPLWVILFLAIIIGGIGDSVSDVILIVKGIIYYIHIKDTDRLSEKDEKEEFIYLTVKIVIVAAGGICAMLGIHAGCKYMEKKNSPFMMECLVALPFFWKLIGIVDRIILLCYTFWAIAKYGFHHQPDEVKAIKIGLEAVTFIDFCFISLPIGVTVIVEMCIGPKPFMLDPLTIWEIIKLSCLAIDLIGLTYFAIFILNDKENISSLLSFKENIDEKETKPLINNNHNNTNIDHNNMTNCV